jgi:hypothetical protein
MISFTVLLILIFGLALFLRLLPCFGKEGGVDHWFWKKYVQEVHSGGVFPPAIPQYLLDEQQWYPPLFPFLLTMIREEYIDRFGRYFSALVDMVRFVLVVGIVGNISQYDEKSILICACMFAVTPILVSYNFQLNPRIIASLLFDLITFFIFQYGIGFSLNLILGVGFLGGLLLLTHKMTSQLFVVLCLGLGIIQKSWFIALIPVFSILWATILSGGLYLKVLRAHFDILLFWTRHSNLLGAHPLKESPLYGVPGYVSPGRVFQPGLKSVFYRVFSYFAGPWAPCVGGALLGLLVYSFPVGPVFFWGSVVLLEVGFSLLTILIPPMRGLGYGNLYLFNICQPASVLLGLMAAHSGIVPMAALLFFFSLVMTLKGLHMLYHHPGLKLSDELLERIRLLPEGNWLCLPFQLSECVAYFTRHAVLWGAHGYGFRNLEGIFPVIAEPLEKLVEKHQLRYFLIHEQYREDFEKTGFSKYPLFSSSGFHVFSIETVEERE